MRCSNLTALLLAVVGAAQTPQPDDAAATALAQTVSRAVAAARPADALPALQQLVRTGSAAAAAAPALLAAIPSLPPAERALAMTALGNGALYCDDEIFLASARARLRALAGEGLMFSPAADSPSSLWYDYVRTLRRLDVRCGGTDAAALRATLDKFVAQRANGPLFGGVRKPDHVHDLTSWGWHGAQELLGAIAELTARTDATAAITEELARFLACEPPRPVRWRTEGNAGIGEEAAMVPARSYPVLWLDDYRIVIARTLLAVDPQHAAAAHAVWHVLYSLEPADRRDALARMRTAGVQAADVPHLLFQLDDPGCDRLVLRETIVLLGIAGQAAEAAIPRLQQLAAGDDKELRAIAARALETLRR